MSEELRRTHPARGRAGWRQMVAAALSVATALVVAAPPAGAAPAVTAVQVTPGAAHPGEPVMVSVAVSGRPASVVIDVTTPTATITVSAADPDSDGTYTASLDAPVNLGTYPVTARAEDASGTATATARLDVKAIDRLAGVDRITTAVAVSKVAFPDQASAAGAVLARADAFPDALAAGPYAKRRGGPVLLTDGLRLSDAVRTELARLLPPGATVTIVGGTAGISVEVERELQGAGWQVERVAGANRHDTSAELALRVGSSDGTAIVTTGASFPDALAVSAHAVSRGVPILLVQRDEVPQSVRDALATLGITRTIVVGGPNAVSAEVAAQLPQPTRISGEDRFETAVAVARTLYGGPSLTDVFLASGQNFPDALAGGLLAGLRGSPVLLAQPDVLPEPTRSFLAEYATQIRYVVALGGAAAVGTEVVNFVDNHLTPESRYDYRDTDFSYEGGQVGTPTYPTAPEDRYSRPTPTTTQPTPTQPTPTQPTPTQPGTGPR